ncbi:MAG: hypothetical protein FWH46_04340 [Methanimicrococcus sp.]|nr:hypothetical protein [Methanimicrococcus sp.]
MESITDVLSNGLKTVQNNLVLFGPAIVMSFIMLIPLLVYIAAILVSFYVFELTEIGGVLIFLLATLCFILFVLLASAYLTGGQIGMAMEATSTGKTTLDHFTLYGKKFLSRMFSISIINLLIQAAALIFWIPAFYAMYNFILPVSDLVNRSIVEFYLMFPLPILIGVILTLIYEVIVSVLFFFVSYNTVADDLSVIRSYKRSVSLLKEKTSQILLFIIVYFFIIFFVSTVIGIVGLIISFLGSILSLILAVVSTVWITRYYMAITEKPLYVKEKITNY